MNCIIFAGNANKQLAIAIAKELGLSLGLAEVATFNDKEIKVKLLQTVSNRDVLIIQSTCTQSGRSVNDNLMELYFLIRTCKRSFAKSITVIFPYYGYAR